MPGTVNRFLSHSEWSFYVKIIHEIIIFKQSEFSYKSGCHFSSLFSNRNFVRLPNKNCEWIEKYCYLYVQVSLGQGRVRQLPI